MTQQSRPKFVAHSLLAPAVTAYPIRMSALGQKQRFDRLPFTSGLPPSTDIVGVRRHVANVPKPTFRKRPLLAKRSFAKTAEFRSIILNPSRQQIQLDHRVAHRVEGLTHRSAGHATAADR